MHTTSRDNNLAANELPVRAAAARVLEQVVDRGRSINDVLAVAQAAHHDPRDAALLQELCYGTLRWYYRLDGILGELLNKPLKASARELHCLLLAGLYQLEYMSLPDRVAVHETVQAVHALGAGWASGLANAVLRNFQRRREALLATVDNGAVTRYAYPEWLIERLRGDWPDDWPAILDAGNQRPPFTLRVNGRRLTRDEYIDRLAHEGLDAAPVTHATHGLVLPRAAPVSTLPGFAGGDVSVQDGAAQLVAGLLQLQPGQRVLDACAAPGGKSAHLLESEPGIELTAVDVDAERLRRVESNLQRLSLSATCVAGDASQPQHWSDGRPFDRILLDVPCSGSGVIRRHPDIKLLRRAADIDALAARQAALLDAVWPLLVPGGMLMYCTCSVLVAENSDQVAGFLARREDAVEVPLDAGWGQARERGRQILPGENMMDGFYFACMRKTS